MKKRKSVELSSKGKYLMVDCHKCGCSKRLEYRKFGRKRKLFGAYEAPASNTTKPLGSRGNC